MTVAGILNIGHKQRREYMHDFPYDFTDICEINFLQSVERGGVRDVCCPFCGRERKLNINNRPGKHVARCNRCGWSGGMLKFHADLNNLSLRDAKRDIERKLSLDQCSDAYREKAALVRAEGLKEMHEEVTLSLHERSRRYCYMEKLLSLEDDHRRELGRRGLSPPFIEARGYRTLPTEKDQRYCLARQMHSAGYNVKNLPGFLQDEDGDYCLKKFTRGYLIPIRSLNCEIEGYQIRKDNDKLKKEVHMDKNGSVIRDYGGKPKLFYRNKFCCLSSPNEKNGGKMHGVCHYAGAYIWDERKKH